jgi:hypothetical protein
MLKIRVMAVVVLVSVAVWFAPVRRNPQPVRWAASGRRILIHAGDTARVTVRATIAPFDHLYSTTQHPGGPTRTTVSLAPGGPFTLYGPVRAPAPDSILNDAFGIACRLFGC